MEAIYDMQRRWIADVLGRGDSLLTPGSAVWSTEHLDELERDFVEQPDLTKDKRFLEKLHDQLAHVSPAAVQLMAELHVVHFLIIWNGAISAAKKRADLEAILSWMPEPRGIPEDVAATLSPGIVHPGQWVLTRRDTQLTWLIRFSRAWKDFSEERRTELLDDPWRLKELTDTITAPASEGARLALLHLTDPDTFEPIVSPNHRRYIVQRFSELAGDDTDTDRQLIAVRKALTPQYGDGFDWYHEPLLHRWLKDSKAWPAFLIWLQRIRALPNFEDEERTYKLKLSEELDKARKLVINGDDGWQASLKAVFVDPSNNLTQWQYHSRFLTWIEEAPASAREILLAMWGSHGSPVERFAAFLDAVPSTIMGTVGAKLNIGSFLLMAGNAASLPPAKITAFRSAWTLAGWGPDKDLEPPQVYDRALVFLDELVRDGAEWPLPLHDRLDAQGAVWALTKWKGNSKPSTWSDERWQEFLTYRSSAPTQAGEEEEADIPDSIEEGDDAALVDHIAVAADELHVDRAVLDEIVELLEDKGQVVLYGPPGTGKTYLALRLARAIVADDDDRISIVQFHPATSYEDFFEGFRPHLTDDGQVTYVRTDGPLVALVEKAASDASGRTYVLVIDEINRANLPKVLGELLFLLEYRRQAVHTLYRPKSFFKLPGNLWLIGTMNTADRSIALIDAAMRRRFHFVPFFPHEGPMKGLLSRWLEDGGGRVGVADFLDAVNAELVEHVGEHLLIGPSHFMKADLSDRALQRIWTYNVFPLIEEQLWGNRAEIDRWRWNGVRSRFAMQLGLSSVEEPAASEEAQPSDT